MMAIVAMSNAVAGQIASSAEYNKLISNITDLDLRLGPVTSTPNAAVRLSSLETLTTDTATNGGQGNAQLASRLGTGVGTTTNVTTGTATAQLTDLRSRTATVETRTTDASTGNTALGSRVTTLETRTTDASTGNVALGTRVATLEAGSSATALVRVIRSTNQTIGNSAFTAVSWSSAPRNVNTLWAVGNPTRLTVPTGQGGLYFLQGGFIFAVNATGARQILVRLNGDSVNGYRRSSNTNAVAGSFFTEVAFSTYLELVAGDYVEVMAWQNSGGNLDLVAQDGSPSFVMRRVA
jgi:hypothetical protein